MSILSAIIVVDDLFEGRHDMKLRVLNEGLVCFPIYVEVAESTGTSSVAVKGRLLSVLRVCNCLVVEILLQRDGQKVVLVQREQIDSSPWVTYYSSDENLSRTCHHPEGLWYIIHGLIPSHID